MERRVLKSLIILTVSEHPVAELYENVERINFLYILRRKKTFLQNFGWITSICVSLVTCLSTWEENILFWDVWYKGVDWTKWLKKWLTVTFDNRSNKNKFVMQRVYWLIMCQSLKSSLKKLKILMCFFGDTKLSQIFSFIVNYETSVAWHCTYVYWCVALSLNDFQLHNFS